jgi:alkylhydroperoxidase/carboxymuconolactone decarboxylase family protein YurZ
MTDSVRERGLKAYEQLFGERRDMSRASSFDELTVDHLYASIWTREGLSMRDRSLITVAVLAALGREAELERHLEGAVHQKITATEIMELMIHVAHYAGWPAGHSGARVANKVFSRSPIAPKPV